MAKVAVLYISHIINEESIKRFKLIEKGLDENHDLYWCLDVTKDKHPERPDKINFIDFTVQELYQKFAGKGWFHRIPTMLMNVNLIMYRFFEENQEYDYYWQIENDVIYYGDWKDFFQRVEESDSDLLSAVLEKKSEKNKSWMWWIDAVDDGIEYIKSFNPIYRISNAGIKMVQKFLEKHDGMFFEVFLPTAIVNEGGVIEDFGGKDEFVKEGKTNKFYIDDTVNGIDDRSLMAVPKMQIKNIKGKVRNKLYHPVKLDEKIEELYL